MSRHEKIKKLHNAIVRYRGIKEERLEVVRGQFEQALVTRWKVPPAPSAASHVKLCMLRFEGIDAEKALKEIDDFESIESLNAWMELLP